LDRETKKEKQRLRKDLDFYLDYYKEVTVRSEKIKEAFDREIERIVEALKEIGK
jgi:actin-like ATPase involved in cell morphogenesis